MDKISFIGRYRVAIPSATDVQIQEAWQEESDRQETGRQERERERQHELAMAQASKHAGTFGSQCVFGHAFHSNYTLVVVDSSAHDIT